MKKRKKQSALTLIEIIIALTIMGMILSLLWQALFGIQKKGLWQQKKAAVCLEKMVFYTKISDLFLKLSKEPPSLHTLSTADGQSLVIHASHPIEKEQDFSGYLTSTLSLKGGHITLTTQARSGHGSISDHFFTYVDEVTFVFFDEETRQWTREWKEEKKKIPTMMRIIYRQGKDVEELTFFPKGDVEPIVYPKRKSS